MADWTAWQGMQGLTPPSPMGFASGPDMNGLVSQLPGMDTGAGMPGLSSGVFGSGMNGMQFAQAAMGGLQTLGNLWMGLKSLNLAKKQFNFSKDFANTNLANQTKVYNTNLSDRTASRAVMQGMSPEQAQSYITSNSLPTKTLGG